MFIKMKNPDNYDPSFWMHFFICMFGTFLLQFNVLTKILGIIILGYFIIFHEFVEFWISEFLKKIDFWKYVKNLYLFDDNGISIKDLVANTLGMILMLILIILFSGNLFILVSAMCLVILIFMFEIFRKRGNI